MGFTFAKRSFFCFPASVPLFGDWCLRAPVETQQAPVLSQNNNSTSDDVEMDEDLWIRCDLHHVIYIIYIYIYVFCSMIYMIYTEWMMILYYNITNNLLSVLGIYIYWTEKSSVFYICEIDILILAQLLYFLEST